MCIINRLACLRCVEYTRIMVPSLQLNSETPLQSGVPVSPLSLEEVERILTPAAHWLRCELYGALIQREPSAAVAIRGAAQLLVQHLGIVREVVSAGSSLDGSEVDQATAVRVACDVIIVTGWAHPMPDLRRIVSRVLTARGAPFERLANDLLPEVYALPKGVIRTIIRDSALLIALQFYDACMSGIASAGPQPFVMTGIECNPLMQRAIVAHGSRLASVQMQSLSDAIVSIMCFCEVLPATLEHHSMSQVMAIIADELSEMLPDSEEVR